MSSPSLRSIWRFRHGLRADWLTDFAPEMVHAKDNDIAPAGVTQFEYCADHMVRQQVDHLISSPYRRCVHSAEIMAKRLGLTIKLEWGMHETHGREIPEVSIPSELEKLYPHVDTETPSLLQPRSHETEASWMQRGSDVMTAMLNAYEGNLCLVSHGNPIVAMQEYLVPGFKRLGMRCAHYTRFDLTENGWHIVEPYGIAHLGFVDASEMRHIDWSPEEEARSLAAISPATPPTIS